MSPTTELEIPARPLPKTPSLGVQKSFHVPVPVVEGQSEVVAYFGPGVECRGEIWYEGHVQIEGRLEGVVHTKGTLVVGDRAVLKATIDAGTVVCKGKIEGDVVAENTIKLLSPGFIDGTLNTPQLSVETGGMFNGRLSMGKSSR